MSYNQSRGQRGESTQVSRTGRSVSSNQQRQFSGVVTTKGGGGGRSFAPTNNPNRSFKKYNSTAQEEQVNERSPNVTLSNSPAARVVENGASDSPVMSNASTVNPMDGPVKKITRAVPRAPSSNVTSAATSFHVSGASSESNAPKTPEKAPVDASKSFSLQFGSISPGFMNGMQIPARTSSAPPKLDEQKKAQAHHESLRTAHAAPVPSIPNQHLPKKIDPPNTGETQQVPKPKRAAQVLAAPPATQAQKPAFHANTTGMNMQLPFHQPQVTMQLGGPNPQIQSQNMSGASLPMPMPMSLPLGNQPVQHSMFVPGLHPHPMQSQGIIHQGQSFNFSPQMGPQLPPQLSGIGMHMASQFPQQSPVKYSGLRKTVKITHPETHEELKLDSLPNPRLHPNVQPQSPFPPPPNMAMNFYPNSYNTSSAFFPGTSTVPHSSTQVPPTIQPQRLYNQVTVKPPIGSHDVKEPLPPISSVFIGKGESSRSSRLHIEDLHKEAKISSSNSSQQALGASSPSIASTGPAYTERNGVHVSASAAPMDGSTSASTNSSMEVRDGVAVPDSVKDKHTRIGITGPEDQVASLSTSRSILPSQLPESDATYASSGSSLVSEYKESKPETVGKNEEREATTEGSKPYDRSLETALKSLSLDSPKITGEVEGRSDRELKGSSSAVLEHSQEKREGDDGNMHVNVAAHTYSSIAQSSQGLVSAINLPVKNDKIDYSDVSLSVPHQINDTKEISATKYSQEEPAPVSVPSLADDALESGNEDIDSINDELVSASPSFAKEKVESDVNVAKSVVPRGTKKKKDLYRKAEASGPSSDLYMAYKGPEEKKESINQAEGSENSSRVSEKQKYTDVVPENTVPQLHPAQSEMEPEDWEDATEISSQLETSTNENQADCSDGNEFSTKRYSRDFLLKFVELCTDLPDGFDITSAIADALMVSCRNMSREPQPSPGHNSERHGGGSRVDRRASGLGDEDKWNKYPGPLMPVTQGDIWMNPGYINNVVSFRPGQGGNYGVLRNTRTQAAAQYALGILGEPIQSFGPQSGLQRNNSDSDQWQRATGFQKGLMPSPHNPMQVMHKAEKKYEVGKATDEEEAKQRQLKGILNKLTPQNFEKLFQQVKQVNIDNVITLSGVISQIFNKALMEPTFCEMYANFCFHLAADLPELTGESERITFKRLLLNKCQEEFEKGEREEEEANKAEDEGEVKQTAEEREEKRLKARRRMLGNIRLIGELYKKRMLTERIMHGCINKLLGEYRNPDEENIEALCKLMSTIGEMIDHPRAKEHMDAYFDIMAQLSNDMKLSSRLRFMLKDAIDLRKNNWQQRRKVEGPKKIEEVHRDAAQERHTQTTRLSRVPSMGNPVRRGPPSMEFASRSPSMLSSPVSQAGSFRGVHSHLRGGYGSQDARMDERYSSENARIIPISLPQTPLGYDSITLGPQGGLARGMSYRGQPNIPLAEMPLRHIPDSFAAQSHNKSHPQERDIACRNREFRNSDPNLDRSLPTSPHAHGGQSGSLQNVSSDKVFPEEQLRDKSMATIKEFYSARDEKEVVLCIKDFNTPSFYPSMISIWVSDSFERKDMERDLLTKLLINLTKSHDGVISKDQLIKGFEYVLDLLEDAVNDAPKAADFLGQIFAKVILENIIPLSKIGQLIYEGGEEQGRLVEIGLAAEVLGSILDIIKSEKGDSVLNEMRSSSKLQLGKFRPPGCNKPLRIDKFI